VRWAGVDIHTWNHDIDSVDCLRKQLAALEAERDIARVALRIRYEWCYSDYEDWRKEHMSMDDMLNTGVGFGLDITTMAYAIAESEQGGQDEQKVCECHSDPDSTFPYCSTCWNQSNDNCPHYKAKQGGQEKTDPPACEYCDAPYHGKGIDTFDDHVVCSQKCKEDYEANW
jgi:hypothetical protein